MMVILLQMEALILWSMQLFSPTLNFLKQKRTQQKESRSYFRIEDVQSEYVFILSFKIFKAFFEFLGPTTEHLNYWGEKEGTHKRNRSRKLDTKNQLFLTLVKLRLN